MPRPRTVLIPLAAVAVIAGGWTAVWHWGSARAEDMIQKWLASSAAEGRVIECGERRQGGFPFRLEITCTKPVVEFRSETRPYRTIRLEGLKVVSQIWNPGHVIAEWTGPMAMTSEAEPGLITASWRLARTSAQMTVGGYERSSVVVEDLKVERDGQPLLSAAHGELHTRPNVADPVSLDVAASLKSALVLGQTAAPVDSEIQLVARKLLRSPNRPQPLEPRRWQQAGGSVELVLLRIVQGEALGVASGQLRLTADGKPDGQIDVKVANLDRAVQANGLGGTLGAVVAGLTFTSRPTDVEGRPGRLISLRAAEGRLQFGPVRVGLPSLW